MNRIFKCKLTIPNVSIRIVEQDYDIDHEYHANLVFSCSYQVDDEKKFKDITQFDITNAIHRCKIEDQLKDFLSKIIFQAFADHKIGKMKYRQVKECDVDIQDEIKASVKKFYLIKCGLDILEIEMIEIKLSYQDQKDIDERIRLQQVIYEVSDLDTEMKLRLPDFVDQKAEKENKPWTCSCGSINRTKFCPNCGAKKEDEINKIVLTL